MLHLDITKHCTLEVQCDIKKCRGIHLVDLKHLSSFIIFFQLGLMITFNMRKQVYFTNLKKNDPCGILLDHLELNKANIATKRTKIPHNMPFFLTNFPGLGRCSFLFLPTPSGRLKWQCTLSYLRCSLQKALNTWSWCRLWTRRWEFLVFFFRMRWKTTERNRTSWLDLHTWDVSGWNLC